MMLMRCIVLYQLSVILVIVTFDVPDIRGFVTHVLASKTMVYMLPLTSKFADGNAGSTAFPFCEKLNIDVTLGLSLDEMPL